MPSSTSSVHGLARTLELDLDADPRDAPEQMMRRVDRDEVEAVCRHLIGRSFDLMPRETVGAGAR